MKRLPEWVWAPPAAALLTAVVGATGVWAGLPWLLPSLGPTIFLQVHEPDLASAQPWNVVAATARAFWGGVAGVLLMAAQTSPPVLSDNVLTWPRLWAATIAMAETLAVQVPLRTSHPPAAATALLVAL